MENDFFGGPASQCGFLANQIVQQMTAERCKRRLFLVAPDSPAFWEYLENLRRAVDEVELICDSFVHEIPSMEQVEQIHHLIETYVKIVADYWGGHAFVGESSGQQIVEEIDQEALAIKLFNEFTPQDGPLDQLREYAMTKPR